MKIVIFGAYKSGTTGLFYKIKNSMPTEPRVLFEPAEYTPEPFESAVLAKVMIGYPPPSKYETFLGFDKKILLVRDPRDWLVSGLLFIIQQQATIYNDDAKVAHLLELFRQKENDPHRISVHDLLDEVYMASENHHLSEMRSWFVEEYDWLLAFDGKIGDHFRLKYEDFVDDKLDALAQYLGLKLHGKAVVEAVHNHVPRSMRHGDWRNWFTEQDVNYFKPIFEAYMRKYDYADEWALAQQPQIAPEHSTGYIERTVKKRRS
ncbi:MAG: hypothetical protein ABI835_09710 [Chloroflexota bacterium]